MTSPCATPIEGDCLERMAEMPAESVDALVTDPPYGISFLGREWDHGVPGVPFWEAALRVAKPGAHLLAFGSPRTSHRLACAIEDAGWELRDTIMWLYGQGMPKGQDIGKAIDKGRRRDYVEAAVRLGMSIPGNSLHDWTKAEHAPSDRHWERFKSFLTPEQWGAIERDVIGSRTKARTESGNFPIRGLGAKTIYETWDVTAPATDAARAWDGWNTQLKPAHEPILVFRKPFKGTVAANVLEHGCGALNVGACRVGYASPEDMDQARVPQPQFGVGGKTYHMQAGTGRNGDVFDSSRGRYPANVVLQHSPGCNGVCSEDCAVRLLDEQAGERKGCTVSGTKASPSGYGGFPPQDRREWYGDTGGASRFFYCPKASPSERGDFNTHPTVKPIALMRWLVRLVTRPGGLVLDPFCGSGSTLLAALDEGMDAIGIDNDPASVEIARRRLEGRRASTPLFA